MAKVRLNVNLEDKMMARIDEYAKAMNITRTSAITVLCSQALDYQQVINSLPMLIEKLEIKK